MKKSSRNFTTRYENLVAIFPNFSPKFVVQHCVVSSLAKQNMSPQYLCVNKPLKMANDQRNEVMHIARQLNYVAITLSSD